MSVFYENSLEGICAAWVAEKLLDATPLLLEDGFPDHLANNLWFLGLFPMGLASVADHSNSIIVCNSSQVQERLKLFAKSHPKHHVKLVRDQKLCLPQLLWRMVTATPEPWFFAYMRDESVSVYLRTDSSTAEIDKLDAMGSIAALRAHLKREDKLREILCCASKVVVGDLKAYFAFCGREYADEVATRLARLRCDFVAVFESVIEPPDCLAFASKTLSLKDVAEGLTLENVIW